MDSMGSVSRNISNELTRPTGVVHNAVYDAAPLRRGSIDNAVYDAVSSRRDSIGNPVYEATTGGQEVVESGCYEPVANRNNKSIPVGVYCTTNSLGSSGRRGSSSARNDGHDDAYLHVGGTDHVVDGVVNPMYGASFESSMAYDVAVRMDGTYDEPAIADIVRVDNSESNESSPVPPVNRSSKPKQRSEEVVDGFSNEMYGVLTLRDESESAYA
jgi:hypothetical protein